ncbi:MAG: hypothetical protein NC251_07565 [Lachnoclostridium sp.]|nr:hypothetical protein [Lachnospira sp.]MCM1248270.1 hypothetical protein [Lachnoclostridium sp.]
MKKLVRTITMVFLGTLLFATTAFAAEANIPTEQIQSLETQIISGNIPEILYGSSSKGDVVVAVLCSYTGQWEEGYYGWINNASFYISGAIVGNIKYETNEVIPVGHLLISGSSAYQNYNIGGVSVTISVTMDEWGDASLGMVVN